VEVEDLTQLKEELRLFREAPKEAARQIVSAAEAEAQRIVEGAKAEAAQILSDARDRSEALLESSEDIIQQRVVEERETQERFYQERISGLELKEKEVAARADELRMREAELDIREEDFQFDKETIDLRRRELQKRWDECSPDRVWALGRELEGANRRAEQMGDLASQLQLEVQRLRDAEVATAGRPVTALLFDLKQSQKRVKDLSDRLAIFPTEQEFESLKQDAAEVRVLREQRTDLQRQLASAEERAVRLELGVRELSQVKTEIDALRILNDELRRELQQNAEVLTQRTGQCFPELTSLDEAPGSSGKRMDAFTAAPKFLSALVTHVGEYAAAQDPPLYYSESDIRAFIAGLATSRLLILQGLSGTGKTSLPRVFADAIGGGATRITVQSNWRDRHELLGYYNDFNKRFSESEFTQAVYRAGLPVEENVPWFIVLDEMNLARCEYYFADFLSLLENPDKNKWLVELMSFDPSVGGVKGPRHLKEGRYLKVTDNLWFVGTANQDESTFEITDKVYDRAQVIEFRQRHERLEPRKQVGPRKVTHQQLANAFAAARRSDKHQLQQADWDFVKRLDDFMRDRYDITFGNRIEDQLETFIPVYVGCGGKKEEALDIQIARKILRKLEHRHDPGMVQSLPELEKILRACPDGWSPLRASLTVVERKKGRSI
jgi:MoxR-like ATPase